jgi:two-component system, cell cycle sensor histidine kinase and response regulator CckA
MKKFLIVDDIQENLYLLQVLLSANGFDVEQASNGLEALERARRAPPDMIISDILMPVMDGYALCRAWKEDERLKNIPFIFYSATYTEPKDQEFALKLGADRFFIKPIEPDKFLALLLEIKNDYEAGKFVSPSQPIKAPEYLKEYNAALIRKLEDKMLQIEKGNRILEQDIVEQKQTEEALRASEEKWRLLVRTIPDYVAVHDREGRFEYLNRYAAGYSEQDVIGKSLYDFVSPESKELFEKKFEECLLFSRVLEFESQAMGDNGVMRDYDTFLVPIRQQDAVVNIMVISRDVTERKLAEEKQKKLEDQLRQSQKLEAIGQLSSGVAHDFNNLLGGIMGHAELAKQYPTAGPELLNRCASIITLCEKAADLTRQLLSFARKAPVEFREIDLCSFIKQVTGLLERTIDRSIQIVSELKAESLFILADRNQLENALLNIAINARDAMPQGGRLCITLESVDLDNTILPGEQFETKKGSYADISIADTGTGMSEEIKDRIFEPFFTTKEIGKGTGLGLASVYGCVKQHNGYITVKSQVGKGTRFDLYFPIAPSGQLLSQKEEGRLLPGKGSLLLVDDETVYHENLTKIFEPLGYSVHCCSDGVKAVEYFRINHSTIDVVILDMNMPKMSGLQCFRRLKEINPNVKVIVASGYGENEDRATLRNEGVAAFVQKPCSSAELAKEIAKLVKG